MYLCLVGMVLHERLSEEPSSTTDLEEVDTSEYPDTTSETSSQEENESALAVANEEPCQGVFENIVIKNSANVQFGNNSYYQGPVTIKQVVYSNAPDVLSIGNGKDNPSFEADQTTDTKCQDNESKVDSNELKSNKGKCAQLLNSVVHDRKILIPCLGIILLSILILTVALLLTRQYSIVKETGGKVFPEDSSETDHSVPIDPPIDPEANVTLSGKLRIVPRLEWIAQPPAQPATPLNTPVPYVIILHTATENCSDQATCVYHVRYIQTFHMESKGWWDIAYNFLVGGDGNAYEGRGWKSEGANAYGYNSRCIGIAFIGTFNSILPPPRQIRAAKQLIELGVEKGYISPDYKLLAHRQVSSTKSPGDVLYEDIKTWPHWSPSP